MAMLPAAVRALIARSIHSMAALELLLLLHRSPDTYWTASAAASSLEAPEEAIASALDSLLRQGLLVEARETVAFRYAPRNEDDREAVDALASAYEQHRLPVFDAVYAARSGAIEAFAEAFRIRRD